MKLLLDISTLRMAGLQGNSQRATRLRGLVLAVGGTLFISANFVTVKYVLSEYNPFTFLPLWFIVASLASTVWLMASRPPWRVQVQRNLWPLAAVGLTNGVAAALIFGGLSYLDPSVAAFLARSGTLCSIILGYVVLGERFSRRCGVGMVLILAGVGVITYSSGGAQLLGIVLVLVGYVFSSVNYLLGKQVTNSTNPVVLIWTRSVGSLAVAIVIAALSGRFDWHFSLPHLSVLVGGAMVGPVLGQMMSFYSMRYIGLSELEIVRATQPLIVLVYSLAFLGMLPTLREALGGLVMIVGVVLLVRSRSVERTKIPSAS